MGRLLTLLRKKGGEFRPSDLPGLALWLDASDSSTITESAGAVSQWDDKSGNARHVSQAVAGNQPTTGTATIDEKNALAFDGDLLMTAEAYAAATSTSFVVMKAAGGSTNYVLDAFDGDDRASPLFEILSRWWYTAGSNRDTGVSAATGDVLMTSVLNGANSSLRQNGATIDSGNAGSFAWKLAAIGSSFNLVSSFDGPIGEVVVYESALTVDEIAQVESYLAAKWGITLA